MEISCSIVCVRYVVRISRLYIYAVAMQFRYKKTHKHYKRLKMFSRIQFEFNDLETLVAQTHAMLLVDNVCKVIRANVCEIAYGAAGAFGFSCIYLHAFICLPELCGVSSDFKGCDELTFKIESSLTVFCLPFYLFHIQK